MSPSRLFILTHGLFPVPNQAATGNGIRALALAAGLRHAGFEIIYATQLSAAQAAVTPVPAGLTLAAYTTPAELAQAIAHYAPTLLLVGYWDLLRQLPADLDLPIVLDLLAPRFLEVEFQEQADLELELVDYLKYLHRADHFLCCTPRQRDFHEPWLHLAGVPDPASALSLVPISTAPELPVRPKAAASTVDTGPVLVYGGVIWPWRDPSGWIPPLLESLSAAQRGKLRLIVGKYPLLGDDVQVSLSLPDDPRYAAYLETSDLLPYEAMQAYYLQADVGIELGARNCERELSFSFRVIDYLRCGLPVICNDFLQVADLIREYDAGWVLPEHDPAALTALVTRIVTGQEDLAGKSRNAQRLVQAEFNQERTIEPLLAFCRQPYRLAKQPHFYLPGLLQQGSTWEQHEAPARLAAASQALAALPTPDSTPALAPEALHGKITVLQQSTLNLHHQLDKLQHEQAVWQQIAEERRLSRRLGTLLRGRAPWRSQVPPPPALPAAPLLCPVRAAAEGRQLHLDELFSALPVTPDAGLLNQQPFDYQLNALQGLLRHTGVHGKTVLEVGADDANLLARLAEQGMSRGYGINNWYWQTDSKIKRVTPEIILSYGNICALPLADESFDLIYTIAAFEHIHHLDQALLEMYRLLKPGGLLYSNFGPLWSSAIGHHLWFEWEGHWFRFPDAASYASLMPPFAHLLYDREQLAASLRPRWDETAIARFIYEIYDNPHINRYTYADYLRLFNESPFEIAHLENVGALPPDAETQAKLAARFQDPIDFSCSSMEVVLRKPGGPT